MTRPSGEFCLGFGVELLANGSDLTKLKFGEPETAPAFSSADQRAEHQLENEFFAEAVGNDLSRRRCSTNKRSSKLVVRVVRRWVTGNRRCAMQASKSSSKQETADARGARARSP